MGNSQCCQESSTSPDLVQDLNDSIFRPVAPSKSLGVYNVTDWGNGVSLGSTRNEDFYGCLTRTGRLIVWRFPLFETAFDKTYDFPESPRHKLRFSHDSRRLAVLNVRSGIILVLAVPEFHVILEFKCPTKDFISFEWMNDHELILAREKSMVSFFDIRSSSIKKESRIKTTKKELKNINVLCSAKPMICIVGFGDELCIVTHSASGLEILFQARCLPGLIMGVAVIDDYVAVTGFSFEEQTFKQKNNFRDLQKCAENKLETAKKRTQAVIMRKEGVAFSSEGSNIVGYSLFKESEGLQIQSRLFKNKLSPPGVSSMAFDQKNEILVVGDSDKCVHFLEPHDIKSKLRKFAK